MKRNLLALFAIGLLSLSFTGCGDGDVATNDSEQEQTESTFLITEEPSGAIPVGEARQSAENDAEVVLVGRIGGSVKPFIDDLAAFTIVDSKVPHCHDDEGCPTPWDYCCEQDQVKDNIAMIKVVDENGKPVSQDARKLLGVKELSTVVIRGKAQRDDEGNLAVLAKQVYVKD